MRFLCVLLALLSLAANAASITVDFEGVVGDNDAANITTFPGSVYVEDGIGFSFTRGEAAVSGRYISANIADYGSAFL